MTVAGVIMKVFSDAGQLPMNRNADHGTPGANLMSTALPAAQQPETASPESAAAFEGPKPPGSFEDHVRAAQAGIRAGQTPSQIKSALLGSGVDPLTAETAYRTARRRLFDSNRRLGARLAAYSIAALCGGTLLFVPLSWKIPLVVVLLGGLLLMGIATLVWLTGIGADEP